jgi:hypothetical protein
VAFIYHTTSVTPSKLELLSAWLPAQPWFAGGLPLTQLGAYRFDDPEGEVGIETFLVDAGGPVLHVPVTYRATPLEGASLVGYAEHSLLGPRYVYDGCTDPVWAAAAIEVILTGGTEAAQYVEVDGEVTDRGSTATAAGSGTAGTAVAPVTTASLREDGVEAVVDAGPYTISLLRVVGPALGPADATLTVRWPDGGPAELVGLRATG